MAPAPEGASTGERRARGAYRRGALTRHLPCASSGQRSQRFGLCDRTWLWAAQRSQIMRIRQIATILLRFRLARTLAPAVNAHIRTFAPTPARNHAQEAFAGTAPARLKFPKSRRKPFRNRPWVHARQREDEAMRRSGFGRAQPDWKPCGVIVTNPSFVRQWNSGWSDKWRGASTGPATTRARFGQS